MKNVKRFMPKYDWNEGRYLPMEANDEGDFVKFADHESALANAYVRIHSRCPACRNDTLTLNDGHLLCSWHNCSDPTLIDRLGTAVVTPPANPNTTEALASVLRAILEAVDEKGELWDIPLGLYNDANNALHMAQLPVVPVSEDVETIRKTLNDFEGEIGYFNTRPMLEEALAALDRLAAAAGRKDK